MKWIKTEPISVNDVSMFMTGPITYNLIPTSGGFYPVIEIVEIDRVTNTLTVKTAFFATLIRRIKYWFWEGSIRLDLIYPFEETFKCHG